MHTSLRAAFSTGFLPNSDQYQGVSVWLTFSSENCFLFLCIRYVSLNRLRERFDANAFSRRFCCGRKTILGTLPWSYFGAMYFRDLFVLFACKRRRAIHAIQGMGLARALPNLQGYKFTRQFRRTVSRYAVPAVCTGRLAGDSAGTGGDSNSCS